MFTFSKVTRPNSPVNPAHNIYTTYQQQRPASPPQFPPKLAPANSPSPSPHYHSGMFYKPAEHLVKVTPSTLPNHRRIVIPIQYHPANLYYSASPHNRSTDSKGSLGNDRNDSHSGYKYNVNQFYQYPRRRDDGRGVLAPLPGMSYIRTNSSGKQYKVNIRYSSPPSSPLPGKKPEILNSKSSVFTFGEPKKPQILKGKKPGVRRMNSVGSSASEQGYKVYVHYDTENKQNPHPHPTSNSFSKSKEISNIYEQHLSSKSINKLPQAQNNKNTENQTLNYSISEQVVNVTPSKKEQESTGMGMGVAKIDEHTYEQQHRIANLLTGELQLNYEYFRDVDKSDKSISDYVVL